MSKASLNDVLGLRKGRYHNKGASPAAIIISVVVTGAAAGHPVGGIHPRSGRPAYNPLSCLSVCRPIKMKNILFSTLILCGALMLQGCVGLVIGTATDAAIAVAKVPFKVGGAVIDVVAGDEEDEED